MTDGNIPPSLSSRYKTSTTFALVGGNTRSAIKFTTRPLIEWSEIDDLVVFWLKFGFFLFACLKKRQLDSSYIWRFSACPNPPGYLKGMYVPQQHKANAETIYVSPG